MPANTEIDTTAILPKNPVAAVKKPGYDVMARNVSWKDLPKDKYSYIVYQADVHDYFQFGIAPLCIFCCAVFSIFWGTLAGLLIRRVNMNDYTGVELCIKQFEKSEETIAKAGLKPQEPADVVMRTLNAVGIKITDVSSFISSTLKGVLSILI